MYLLIIYISHNFSRLALQFCDESFVKYIAIFLSFCWILCKGVCRYECMWTCHIFLYVDLHYCSSGTVYWVIFEGNMISIYVFGLCHISFYVALHCNFGKYWCNIIYWWQLNVPKHFYFDLSHISLCELTLQFWDFFCL